VFEGNAFGGELVEGGSFVFAVGVPSTDITEALVVGVDDDDVGFCWLIVLLLAIQATDAWDKAKEDSGEGFYHRREKDSNRRESGLSIPRSES